VANAFQNNAGGTAGAVTNSGFASNAGTIASLSNSGGTFSNSNEITASMDVSGGLVDNQSSGTVGGETTITGDGVVNNYGSLQAVDNSSIADYGFRNFGSAGDVTNSGFSLNDEFATMLSLTNTGGIFENYGTINGPINVSGGTFTNNGLVTGPVQNYGTLIGNNGSSFSGGSFNNTGVFHVNGAATVAGPATNAGLVNMQNGGATDRLTFNSTLSGNGSYAADVNQSTGASDLVVAAGGASGTQTFSFNLQGDQVVGRNFLFFSDSTASAAVALGANGGGLATGGTVVNTVRQTSPGQWVVETIANPAIGSIVANLTITDMFIANVVNRPTSPFTAGSATGDGSCSSGGFARGLAGEATIEGKSSTDLVTTTAEQQGDYTGFQAGFDYGCVDDLVAGWDVRFGLTFGINNGSLSQDVFAINPLTGAADGSLSSVVDTSFDQAYGGFYAAFQRDSFFGDVQLRYDDTQFDLTESAISNSASLLGVNGQDYSSSATTLAARFNYSVSLSEKGTTFLIPTAGFSYSSVDGGTLNFDGGERLELGDYSSTVGFAGVIARSTYAPSANSFLTPFAGLTYYGDSGGDRTSTFYNSGNGGGSEVITAEGLGGYGELSIGLNYIADASNNFGTGSTFSAAIRADARAGDSISDAYSLTAQFRLSF
jgi:outer membrane autotransporter protein